MLPEFSLWGIHFYTFPFVILFALAASVMTYLLAPQYKKFYCISVFRLFLPVLLGAAIGARLFSAITLLATSSQSFWHNLIYGGAVFYGGVIGGAIALLITCRYQHREFLVFSDLFVTLLPIGQAIGRLGCYCNGCCYGSRYDGILAVNYLVDGVYTTVFPTWFLEAGFCLILFLYFQLFHRNNQTGIRSAIYLIAYSVYRFLIEFLRGDAIRGHLGRLSSSQIISIVLLITGLCILFICRRDKCNNFLFEEGEKKQ